MGTLVVDAFRVSQSHSSGGGGGGGGLSASASNSLGGAAEDLVVSAPREPYDPTIIFRRIPVVQHFGNPVCILYISIIYLYIYVNLYVLWLCGIMFCVDFIFVRLALPCCL
jgi:hypothetical protein